MQPVAGVPLSPSPARCTAALPVGQPFEIFMKPFTRLTLASLAVLPCAAFACASCGCSLSSDWEGQGLSSGPGLRLDLRYDQLNQDQVRSGTRKVAQWPLAQHEQELFTRNRYLGATLDYSFDADWGLSLQLPLVLRSHASNGFNFDGSDGGSSDTRSLGDAKLVGRYQGLNDEHSLGVQLGVKLPTGSYRREFNAGALSGEPLDRGLQPGTGSTDLIVGLFHLATLSQNWDYFAQAIAQVPLNGRDGYRPGRSLNANLGVRYLGLEQLEPQLQVNAHQSAMDSGVNASPEDSGGRTVYLSPGLGFAVGERAKAYAFVQVPIYQKLNGYQLAPRYTVSVGTRLEF